MAKKEINKRTKIGTVTSNKMQKTVTVTVTEAKMHPIYKKQSPHSTKFHAHTDKDIAEGTKVTITETIPRSKTVKWEVTEIHNASK